MKLFRRLLYAVLMAAVAGGLGEMAVSRPEDSEGPPVLLIIAFGGVLGTLLWSAIFLKEEPRLTRVAQIVLMLGLLAFVGWAVRGEWAK